MFPYEKNWFNELAELRIRYGIVEDDDSIKLLSKEKWKSIVSKHVYTLALAELNHENSLKSKNSHYPDQSSPADARLYFSIRCGTLDIKTLRKYQYDENDTCCRLCGKGPETLGHIISSCVKITRNNVVSDIYSLARTDVETVVARVKLFLTLAEEKEGECGDENGGSEGNP